MDRKMIYLFSLVGFFLMWGVFGFVAAAPRGEAYQEGTMPPVETTAVPTTATGTEGIPVTGKQQPVWTEILGFYGMIGIAALFLILALLSFANKSTAAYAERKSPPPEKNGKR